jgi:hypothetical protein
MKPLNVQKHLLYYVVIIFIFFRHDAVSVSRGRLHEEKPVTGTKTKGAVTDDNSFLFSALHELMEELKGIFHTASKHDYPKEELMMALQVNLRDYPKLKGTPFQVSVNNHTGQEAKEKCQALLTG